MKRIYLSAISAITVFSLGAQGLNKEITIEKEIVPEQRAATRLDVSHTIIAPQFKSQQLDIREGDNGINTRVAEMPLLPVYDWNYQQINRGYLTAGFFPGYNGYATVGYRFIDSEKDRLNSWIEYDGKCYNNYYMTVATFKPRISDQNVNFGTAYTHQFDKSKFELKFNFGYNSVERRFPLSSPDEPFEMKHGNTRFSLSAAYSGTFGDAGIKYYVLGKGGLFKNNTNDESMPYLGSNIYDKNSGIKGTSEANYALYAGVNYNNLGIDLSGDFLNYNQANYIHLAEETRFPELAYGEGKTVGIITAEPSYRYHNDMFQVKIGVKAQYSMNSGDKFHIAPDIKATAVFSPVFSADLTVDGGVYQNSLLSLFNYSHYLNPLFSYDNYSKPYDAKISFTVGPRKGCYLRLYGGYAKYEDYLVSSSYALGSFLVPKDIKGWYGGVALHAEYRNIVKFDAKYDYKPLEYKHNDTKQAVNLAVTVNPISRLTIAADWNLIFGRKYTLFSITGGGKVIEYPYFGEYKDYNSLNLGANYAFTDKLSVFAKCNNILSHKHGDGIGVPYQKINGLVGVNLKF